MFQQLQRHFAQPRALICFEVVLQYRGEFLLSDEIACRVSQRCEGIWRDGFI